MEEEISVHKEEVQVGRLHQVLLEVSDQANKKTILAKKETTLPFPVNQELIIQFMLKFQRLLSIVTNKNSPVIMLMLKPSVKFFTFVH